MRAWARKIWAGHRGRVMALGVVALAVVSYGAVRLVRSAPPLPTAVVERGRFVDYVEVRGEVRAMRSVTLAAPFGAGEVNIIRLVRSGTAVKQGDVVVEFDSTSLRRQLEERRSELRQAEAEIERAEAQARMTEEQNRTALLRAQYDVQRARLEASKQEILSAIEGEKTRLSLEDAEQRLRETEEKLAADRVAAQAEIATRRQKIEKERFEVRRIEQTLASLTVRAPVDGVVTVLPNFRSRGMGGGSPPEFRTGDRAWAGAAVADLPDITTLRFTGRVEEADRGRLRNGQTATVRVDALPDRELAGRVADLSPLAKLDYSSWPPVKNFDVQVELETPDPRLRPGMTANARVAVEILEDVLMVPADAIFERQGRPVVYVLRGTGFDPRPVEILRRGNGRAVISRGVNAGERIALIDPTAKEKPEGQS